MAYPSGYMKSGSQKNKHERRSQGKWPNPLATCSLVHRNKHERRSQGKWPTPLATCSLVHRNKHERRSQGKWPTPLATCSLVHRKINTRGEVRANGIPIWLHAVWFTEK